MKSLTKTKPSKKTLLDMTLYQILDIQKNATAADARKAYRTKARTHHPDAGGDSEVWARIQLAHDVLTSKTRRELYDDTGRTDGNMPHHSKSRIFSLLAEALDKLLQEMGHKGKSPRTVDLLKGMNKIIENSKKEAFHHQEMHRKTVKAIIEAMGRFETDDEDNIMNMLLEHRKRSLEIEINRIDIILKDMEDAAKLLKRYRYQCIEVPDGPDVLRDFMMRFSAGTQ